MRRNIITLSLEKEHTMHITILGASGTIGQRITSEALVRGYEFKALYGCLSEATKTKQKNEVRRQCFALLPRCRADLLLPKI
jgi:hypothetical protein